MLAPRGSPANGSVAAAEPSTAAGTRATPHAKGAACAAAEPEASLLPPSPGSASAAE